MAGMNSKQAEQFRNQVERLFSVQKHAAGTAPGKNPSFGISITHMDQFPASTEVGCQTAVIGQVQTMPGMKVDVLAKPTIVKLGGRKFSRVDTLIEVKGAKIYQRSYDSFFDGYLMNIQIAATSLSELREIDQHAQKLGLMVSKKSP